MSDTSRSALSTLTWSVSACALGAFLAGSMSYVRGTKQLQEEGINPQARIRVIPTAIKAFGLGTGMLAATTGLLWIAVRQFHPEWISTDPSQSSFEHLIQRVKQEVEYSVEFSSDSNKLVFVVRNKEFV